MQEHAQGREERVGAHEEPPQRHLRHHPCQRQRHLQLQSPVTRRRRLRRVIVSVRLLLLLSPLLPLLLLLRSVVVVTASEARHLHCKIRTSTAAMTGRRR